MTTYTTNEAAAMLGITPGRLRQLATGHRAGKRTIEGWRFTGADIAALRDRPAGRPASDAPRVRDFLTLSLEEARLIVAALNGHLRTEGISPRDELLLSILDSVGPDAEGERLDEIYGVTEWRAIIVRLSALTEAQCAMVLDAAEAFWHGDLDLPANELLGNVGML